MEPSRLNFASVSRRWRGDDGEPLGESSSTFDDGDSMADVTGVPVNGVPVGESSADLVPGEAMGGNCPPRGDMGAAHAQTNREEDSDLSNQRTDQQTGQQPTTLRARWP